MRRASYVAVSWCSVHTTSDSPGPDSTCAWAASAAGLSRRSRSTPLWARGFGDDAARPGRGACSRPVVASTGSFKCASDQATSPEGVLIGLAPTCERFRRSLALTTATSLRRSWLLASHRRSYVAAHLSHVMRSGARRSSQSRSPQAGGTWQQLICTTTAGQAGRGLPGGGAAPPPLRWLLT